MRKFWRLTALVILWGLAGCGPDNRTAVPTFVLPATLVPDATGEAGFLYGPVVAVTRGDLTAVIEAQGELVAKIEEPLLFPVAGLLSQVYIKPGDQVKAGDVIAELDASTLERQILDYALNVKLAQLEVEKLEAENANTINASVAASDLAYQIRIAREEANAAQEAYALAQKQLDQAIAAGEKTASFSMLQTLERSLSERASAVTVASLKVAQLVARQNLLADPVMTQTQAIQLEIAREQAKYKGELYQLAQKQLENTVLRAPFSGSISSFSLQRGSAVGAYQTIGQIADTSEVRVQVLVSGADMAMITPGAAAVVVVTGRTYQAHVTAIDPDSVLWQGGYAQTVTISFDAGQELPYDLTAGADVTIPGETRKNVLLVPVGAVDVFPGQSYVDLVEDSALRRVPVEIGISDGSSIEILSGLEEGQSVALP